MSTELPGGWSAKEYYEHLEYHRKCLVEVARHLGAANEICDANGFRPVLVSASGLNLDLYDPQGVTEVSAGDIAWDILAAIDELKMIVCDANRVLAEHGIDHHYSSEYIERMRDFPVRANPDRRDL